jgi:hypothetical protein
LNSLTVKKTSHSLSYVQAEAPDCQKDGFDSHFVCKSCNNYYTDIEGNPTTLSEITIPMSDHTLLNNCFDSKCHFSICTICSKHTENHAEHILIDADPLPDRTCVKVCECGYAYYFTPIQSEVIINQDKTPAGIGGIPMNKLKLLLFAAIGFLILVFIIIITISLYLILTRKSYLILIGQIENRTSPQIEQSTEGSDDQDIMHNEEQNN